MANAATLPHSGRAKNYRVPPDAGFTKDLGRPFERISGVLRMFATIRLPRGGHHSERGSNEDEQDCQADQSHDHQRHILATEHGRPHRIWFTIKLQVRGRNVSAAWQLRRSRLAHLKAFATYRNRHDLRDFHLDMRFGPYPSRIGPRSIFQLVLSRCSTTVVAAARPP